MGLSWGHLEEEMSSLSTRHVANDGFPECGQRGRKDNYSVAIADWSRSTVM
jgi:hypothetical protein